MSAKDSQSQRQPQFLGQPHVRKSLDSTKSRQFDDSASYLEPVTPIPEPRLPDLDLPQSTFDLTTTFDSIMAEATSVLAAIEKAEPEVQRVHKRASNVLKLSEENQKLQEELRAMNARLEAAERKQQQLKGRVDQPRAEATRAAAATSS